jgi:hypothetical protein
MRSWVLRGVLALAIVSSLAGCGTVGTVNGVQLGEGTVSERQPICGDYEWVCIGAGLAAFGGAVWALQENGHHD